VVARLFRIVRPDRAYFGQKDAQQLRVIRRMTAGLALPVAVVGMPIVREADGLAMSSRNVYLSAEERAHALVLSHSLREAERAVAAGEREAEVVRHHIRTMIASETGVELDYVSVADDETLDEVETIDGPALLLVAARVGRTRLIDNVALSP
jgi:pantoate--beta-alanine ligase